MFSKQAEAFFEIDTATLLLGQEHRFLMPAFRALVGPEAHRFSAAVEHFGNVFRYSGTGKKVLVFPFEVLPMV